MKNMKRTVFSLSVLIGLTLGALFLAHSWLDLVEDAEAQDVRTIFIPAAPEAGTVDEEYTQADGAMLPTLPVGDRWPIKPIGALDIGSIVVLRPSSFTNAQPPLARRVTGLPGMKIWPADPDFRRRLEATWVFSSVAEDTVVLFSSPLSNIPNPGDIKTLADLHDHTADTVMTASYTAWQGADVLPDLLYYVDADGTGDDSAEWGPVPRHRFLGLIILTPEADESAASPPYREEGPSEAEEGSEAKEGAEEGSEAEDDE